MNKLLPILILITPLLSGCIYFVTNKTDTAVSPTVTSSANATKHYQTTGFQMTLDYSETTGKFSYKGKVDLPTPCYGIIAQPVVAESFPEQVTLVVKTKDNGHTVCIQVIEKKDFEGEVQASKDAKWTVMLDGQIVSAD